MHIQRLYLFFYRIPLPSAIVLLTTFSTLFAVIHTHLASKKYWRLAVCFASVCMLIVILYITLFQRQLGSVHIRHLQPFHSHFRWLSGAQPEALRSNCMNIFLFVPLGLFVSAGLPLRWSWRKRVLIGVLSGCVLSIGIETAQYILQCGEAETDDVINNTLGAFIGSGFLPLEMSMERWAKECIRKHRQQ